VASSRLKTLISTSSFGQEDPEPLAKLERAGIRFQLNPYGRTLTEAEAAELLRDVDGVLAGTEPLTAEVLLGARRLKVISRVGSGLENVDLEAARRLGIVVTSTPEAPVDAVAELTLAGILSLLRKLPQMDQALRAGHWRKQMGSLLTGKTVGLVGLGRIGRRLAELLAPFRVRLLAHDIRPPLEWALERGIQMVGLEHLLASADVVSLHATRERGAGYLLGRGELGLLKPGAILVNTARGGLVDEEALAQALERGALAGAYLDTFEREPYSGPLLRLPNVLLTPHVGSYAREARIAMELEAVDNLLRILGTKVEA
jgi:D-3-phosphoglycerate dehydrogenase